MNVKSVRATALLLGAILAAAWAMLGCAFADTRIALVIGNSRYLNTPALGNPGNDASDVAASTDTQGVSRTNQGRCSTSSNK